MLHDHLCCAVLFIIFITVILCESEEDTEPNNQQYAEWLSTTDGSIVLEEDWNSTTDESTELEENWNDQNSSFFDSVEPLQSKINTDPFSPWLRVGNKIFYINTFFSANWYAASLFCTVHGMKLADISSKEEDDALLNYFDQNGFSTAVFWVSGTDLGHPLAQSAPNGNHFSWMSSGKSFRISYSNWAPNEPSHGIVGQTGEVDHCLQINHKRKWNDNTCSMERWFICQQEYASNLFHWPNGVQGAPQ